MSLKLYTADSDELLREIKCKIDEGDVTSWSYDSDGDFTRTDAEHRNSAWLRPAPRTDYLLFTIVAPRHTRISVEDYAVFHAGFLEMLLLHFDESFKRCSASAYPDEGDLIGSTQELADREAREA